MNLLFLEQFPRFGGGSERMSLALCAHAVARGHRAWLVHAEAGDMVAAYERAGAECRQLPVVPIAVRHPLTAIRSAAGLIRTVRATKADAIFTSQVSFVSLLATAGRATGTPTAVHLGLTYDFPSPVFRAGVRRVDMGIAPSRGTADGWLARGWPSRTLRIIANGVDTVAFSKADGRHPARARLGIQRDGLLIAYVGRLVREKGIFTLLRAFAIHRAAGGSGRLLFAGNAPASEAVELGRHIRDAGLDDVCEVRPAVATPEDVYRAADVVVAPSEWDEPFGLVPLEAASCGTLTIVSDRGIMPTFVAPLGEHGIFPSGDVAELAGRLKYWMDDTERRERLAAELPQHVQRHFGFDTCGDAYLAAFASSAQ